MLLFHINFFIFFNFLEKLSQIHEFYEFCDFSFNYYFIYLLYKMSSLNLNDYFPSNQVQLYSKFRKFQEMYRKASRTESIKFFEVLDFLNLQEIYGDDPNFNLPVAKAIASIEHNDMIGLKQVLVDTKGFEADHQKAIDRILSNTSKSKLTDEKISNPSITITSLQNLLSAYFQTVYLNDLGTRTLKDDRLKHGDKLDEAQRIYGRMGDILDEGNFNQKEINKYLFPLEAKKPIRYKNLQDNLGSNLLSLKRQATAFLGYTSPTGSTASPQLQMNVNDDEGLLNQFGGDVFQGIVRQGRKKTAQTLKRLEVEKAVKEQQEKDRIAREKKTAENKRKAQRKKQKAKEKKAQEKKDDDERERRETSLSVVDDIITEIDERERRETSLSVVDDIITEIEQNERTEAFVGDIESRKTKPPPKTFKPLKQIEKDLMKEGGSNLLNNYTNFLINFNANDNYAPFDLGTHQAIERLGQSVEARGLDQYLNGLDTVGGADIKEHIGRFLQNLPIGERNRGLDKVIKFLSEAKDYGTEEVAQRLLNKQSIEGNFLKDSPTVKSFNTGLRANYFGDTNQKFLSALGDKMEFYLRRGITEEDLKSDKYEKNDDGDNLQKDINGIKDTVNILNMLGFNDSQINRMTTEFQNYSREATISGMMNSIKNMNSFFDKYRGIKTVNPMTDKTQLGTLYGKDYREQAKIFDRTGTGNYLGKTFHGSLPEQIAGDVAYPMLVYYDTISNGKELVKISGRTVKDVDGNLIGQPPHQYQLGDMDGRFRKPPSITPYTQGDNYDQRIVSYDRIRFGGDVVDYGHRSGNDKMGNIGMLNYLDPLRFPIGKNQGESFDIGYLNNQKLIEDNSGLFFLERDKNKREQVQAFSDSLDSGDIPLDVSGGAVPSRFDVLDPQNLAEAKTFQTERSKYLPYRPARPEQPEVKAVPFQPAVPKQPAVYQEQLVPQFKDGKPIPRTRIKYVKGKRTFVPYEPFQQYKKREMVKIKDEVPARPPVPAVKYQPFRPAQTERLEQKQRFLPKETLLTNLKNFRGKTARQITVEEGRELINPVINRGTAGMPQLAFLPSNITINRKF